MAVVAGPVRGGGAGAGAASPGRFHPDEPRAPRSSDVIWDKGKPVLPVSSPCQGVLVGAACPAMAVVAVLAWVGDGEGVWVPGDLAGRAGAWLGMRR